MIEQSVDFDFYKTLFDPVRAEIMLYLAIQDEPKSTKEIAEQFPQDRSVISRHLDLMNRFGIVSRTKESRSTFYQLNSNYILEKFETTTNNLKKIIECK